MTDEIDTSTAATLQQIAKLREREIKLSETRLLAEEQMLHRLGTAHRRGDLTIWQLRAAYKAYRELGIEGFSKRWNLHVGIPWGRVLNAARWAPNGPEDTWVGEWPLNADDARPRDGMPIVYILFDDRNVPCYVGSTEHFHARLKHHDDHGKMFDRWQAYPCVNREEAYRLEVRLLAERKPYLNRRVGR